MLTLLKQAAPTPCLFAIVMPHSGFVVLEEMTDAEQSLSWGFGTMHSKDATEGTTVGEGTQEDSSSSRRVIIKTNEGENDKADVLVLVEKGDDGANLEQDDISGGTSSDVDETSIENATTLGICK
jgi:hypothetical protein